MIGWLLSTRAGRAISGALVAMMTFLGVWVAGRKSGAEKAENEALRENAKRIEKGRKAVADGRRSGKPRGERLRDNDAKW